MRRDSLSRDVLLRNLLQFIRFVEGVTAKLYHPYQTREERFRRLRDEFARSRRYIATVLLLDEQRDALRVEQTSLSRGIVRAAERAAGANARDFRISLERSSILRRVVGGESLWATGMDILGELLPRPLALMVSGIMRVGDRPSVLTPITEGGRVIGVLAVSAPEMVEEFIIRYARDRARPREATEIPERERLG